MLVHRSLLDAVVPAAAPPLLRAPDAFRVDIARRALAGQFGAGDGLWVALASLMSHAQHRADDAAAARWSAIDELLAALAPKRELHLDPPAATDDARRSATAERGRRVRLVAEEMEDAGALELADVVLAAYAMAEPTMDTLEAGRVSAQRGRVRWKLGDTGAALARYKETEKLGKRSASDELSIRAWIGFAILARLRGNYPECRRWTERAIRSSERREYRALSGLAHHVAMVSAAVARDFGSALVHGWMAFEAADGDAAVEGDALVNMAQAMLDADHPATARAAFAGALTRSTTSRHLLPALGGYALACARMGDAAEAHRAVAAVVALGDAGSPYETASATLECAAALATIGDAAGPAATLRDRGSAIARQYGFHELVAAADAHSRAPRTLRPATPFTEREHEVCAAIEAMASQHPLADAGQIMAQS